MIFRDTQNRRKSDGQFSLVRTRKNAELRRQKLRRTSVSAGTFHEVMTQSLLCWFHPTGRLTARSVTLSGIEERAYLVNVRKPEGYRRRTVTIVFRNFQPHGWS